MRSAVAAGFLVGYLIYDEIHYALHHHTPKSRLGKRLRELHMRHHFQDDDRASGSARPTGTSSSGPLRAPRRRRAAPVR